MTNEERAEIRRLLRGNAEIGARLMHGAIAQSLRERGIAASEMTTDDVVQIAAAAAEGSAMTLIEFCERRYQVK